VLAVGLTLSAYGQASYQYPFQNPNLPAEQRISDLLSRMTIQEKIYCFGIDPSVPRLGVKGSGHIEGLSGVALGGHGGWQGKNPPVPTTQFPEEKGMGQSWDPTLLEKVGAEEGYEARYASQNVRWNTPRVWRIVGGLVVRGPNADMARDPRWGRNGESYSEDAFFNGTMSVAFIHGLQGNNPRYWQAASLMKHFLANENEDGRVRSSSNFDESLFYDYYSKPFHMGIVQGGADAIMPSYNAWNGTPMTVSPTLKSVLEEKWGFNGIICTDRGALTNLVTQHHTSPSLPVAAAATIHAGINQYLDNWTGPVTDALHSGLITEKDLDNNLRGVFRVMIKLGKLDPPGANPYASIGAGSEPEPWNKPETKALDRRITDESIVLLKNENHTLPLNASKLKSVAIIGPYADQVLFGFYSGLPAYSISPAEGIQKRLGPGVTVRIASDKVANDPVSLAKSSDIAIVVVGNHPTCNAQGNKYSGPCLPGEGLEGHDRRSIDLDQEQLIKDVYAANPHTIVVLVTSFPYAINWTEAHVPAILEMAHSSDEQGSALAEVLFGDYNPAGRLTQTWPKDLTQIPNIMDYNIRDGETYMYFKGTPLYPFGYGLSYTAFAYSHLKVPSSIQPGKTERVSVRVKNTGHRAGDEVVQMYAAYEQPQHSQPAKRLVGFQRISLRPGETKTVDIPLVANDLTLWNAKTKAFELEPGRLHVLIGASSADIKLQATTEARP
jgi:beta-glucosidase